jgi:hypothetical protein
MAHELALFITALLTEDGKIKQKSGKEKRNSRFRCLSCNDGQRRTRIRITIFFTV